ncbi:MAG: hypothetical protein A2136_07530 [Chloroflexi bacterium RBG_16_54_11]|nr:MAG: hypothetical protein A2136_07530 [Chloroflexi bacterium RBG_16_54_11]
MINPANPDFTNHPAHPHRKDFDQRLISWNDVPEMTIVTPFYNTGSVFYETARSVMNQSLQQWEWLIINDGSTDPTALQILEKYRHIDPRIKVIDHMENRGLSAARNTGFVHARCEYVLLLDSDDLLEPTAAEKWWWYLETHPEYAFAASYHVAFGGLNYLWTGGFHDGVMNTERNRVSMMCVIRKSVFSAVGGFDDTIRGGLEDWDFWMRCAEHGYWGGTIPEYLAWYRLRGDHSDRWENMQAERLDEFRALLQNKYPKLYNGEFPSPLETVNYDLTTPSLDIPAFNQLAKTKPHLLIMLPWLVMGGAERFTLNLIDQLIERGWVISIATTAQSDNAWLHEFEKRTSSIFMLPNFIPIKDQPRFLGYLVQSRGFEAILIQGSHEAYRMLSALRAFAPHIPILDYLHFVTPAWMQGGFPRLSLLGHDWIDFSITSCEQVRDWMVAEGANATKLGVGYTGVDPNVWKPDPSLRQQVRAGLAIAADEKVILYAARLEAQKQPLVFAESIIKLAQHGDKFTALVAGEGSLQAELQEKLQTAGPQARAHMLGSVLSERMPAIMAASDILFLPSQNEGVSQAAYEAMACGVVVVGAQVGGQGELVTAECGVLRLPESHQDESSEYAEILHQLIVDPGRRQRMARASRERIGNMFTLEQMGERFIKHLAQTVENKKNDANKANARPVSAINTREIQYLVEYLQAKQLFLQQNQETQRLYQKFNDLQDKYLFLLQPKPPSHWFYLWIRQLFLPLYTRLRQTKLVGLLDRLRGRIKGRWVKDS